MSDVSAGDRTFREDETDQALRDEPEAARIDSDILMGFLSDFRSAVREKQASERSARAVTRPGMGASDVASRFEVGPADPEPWESDPYVGADRQVAPDWWIADDGRWYPPELHPDVQVSIDPMPQVDDPVDEPDLQVANVTVEPEVRTRRPRSFGVIGRFA